MYFRHHIFCLFFAAYMNFANFQFPNRLSFWQLKQFSNKYKVIRDIRQRTNF